MSLNSSLETLVQRTNATANLLDGQSRARFFVSLRADIAAIVNQLNVVYNPLVSALVNVGDDPLDLGISGNVVVTDALASSGSASAFFDTSLNRVRTIKESFDVILSTLAAITSSVTISNAAVVDVSDQIADLLTQLTQANLDIAQLKNDTQSTNYVLSQTGEEVLPFPLSQHIDALGAFFSGFPTTGNSYATVYPSITLEVLLSQVVIDTTLAQTTITDLPTHLAAIRTFVGMDTVSSTPDYSSHGAITIVSNGQSLELAIQELDAAVSAVSAGSSPFATASNITSNSPGTLATDDFVFGSDSLVDDGNANHDNRMFFDKSTGGFAAGTAQSTQWDTVGVNSARFGKNSAARADYSFTSGLANVVDATSIGSACLVGGSNTITDAEGAVILGGTLNEVDTGADGAVVAGSKGQALHPRSRVLGGGGASVGSAQTQECVLLGTWAATDTDVLLTLDGSAPSAANLLYLPTNASAIVRVEYIMRGKQDSTPYFGGGTMTSVIGRISGAAVAGTPLEMEGSSFRSAAVHSSDIFMTSAGNSPLGGATEAIASLVPSGVAGGFYVNLHMSGIMFGGPADDAGRVVARVVLTQVKYVIP